MALHRHGVAGHVPALLEAVMVLLRHGVAGHLPRSGPLEATEGVRETLQGALLIRVEAVGSLARWHKVLVQGSEVVAPPPHPQPLDNVALLRCRVEQPCGDQRRPGGGQRIGHRPHDHWLLGRSGQAPATCAAGAARGRLSSRRFLNGSIPPSRRWCCSRPLCQEGAQHGGYAAPTRWPCNGPAARQRGRGCRCHCICDWRHWCHCRMGEAACRGGEGGAIAATGWQRRPQACGPPQICGDHGRHR
mmetsp:Transcript_101956/g.227829  ORF Transcript_101956/g.227829 Transcript_101956/m.227829 type:complete len:246 (-) Transcript_101956:87-824(-)